jgi:hypothetical protein
MDRGGDADGPGRLFPKPLKGKRAESHGLQIQVLYQEMQPAKITVT